MLALIALLGVAEAAEGLVFAPDRPGVGESCATAGPGHFLFEGAVSANIRGATVAPGTSSLTARIGIVNNVEARIGLPDITLTNGFLSFGPVAVGVKLASGLSDTVSVSLVPDVLIALDGTGLGLRTSANAGLDFDPVFVWLNSTATVISGNFDFVAGGGVGVGFGSGGIYLNAGGELVAATPFFGGGGWWGLTDALQIDIGVDIWLDGNSTTTVPMLGMSGGF